MEDYPYGAPVDGQLVFKRRWVVPSNHKLGHCFLVGFGLAIVSLLVGCTSPRMEFVRVAPDNKGFIFTSSNKPFIPWGHNYGVNEPEENGVASASVRRP